MCVSSVLPDCADLDSLHRPFSMNLSIPSHLLSKKMWFLDHRRQHYATYIIPESN